MTIKFKALAAAFLVLASTTLAEAQIRDRPAEVGANRIAGAPHLRPMPPNPGAATFEAPELVSAILSGPLALLQGHDRGLAGKRMFYVLGFSLAADKACDFLKVPTWRELNRMIAPTLEPTGEPQIDEANSARLRYLAAGIRDGTTFMARNACGSAGGSGLTRSLAALWESV